MDEQDAPTLALGSSPPGAKVGSHSKSKGGRAAFAMALALLLGAGTMLFVVLQASGDGATSERAREEIAEEHDGSSQPTTPSERSNSSTSAPNSTEPQVTAAAPVKIALSTVTTAPVVTLARTTTSVGLRVPPALPSSYPCRTLRAQGYTYADVMATFDAFARPTLMDGDIDGVPCESAFPGTELTAFWNARALPAGAVLCSPDPCLPG